MKILPRAFVFRGNRFRRFAGNRFEREKSLTSKKRGEQKSKGKKKRKKTAVYIVCVSVGCASGRGSLNSVKFLTRVVNVRHGTRSFPVGPGTIQHGAHRLVLQPEYISQLWERFTLANCWSVTRAIRLVSFTLNRAAVTNSIR